MSCKTWDLTLNNYTPGEVSTFESWSDDVRRMVISKEVSDTGTPHLQGRITFCRSYRMAALKKLVPRAHWEPTNKTQDSLYCKKVDSEVIINVNNRHQGSRTDLKEATDAMIQGASVAELYREHTAVMVKYPTGMMKARQYLCPRPSHHKYTIDDFTCPLFNWDDLHSGRGRSLIFHGEAECGKTEFAKCHFDRFLLIRHMDALAAYDPSLYDGIIFDDMSFKHLPRTAQIHIVDVDNDSDIHIRYSTVFIPAGTKKIFTTNDMTFFDLEDPAIKSRVKVVHFDKSLKRVRSG